MASFSPRSAIFVIDLLALICCFWAKDQLDTQTRLLRPFQSLHLSQSSWYLLSSVLESFSCYFFHNFSLVNENS